MNFSVIFAFSCLQILISSQLLYSQLIFHGTEDTLNRIMSMIGNQEKGGYLRFGDGDLNLAYGEGDLYQKSNPYLQKEMKEAFSLNSPNLVKTIPMHCRELGTLEPGMFPGNHEIPYSLYLNFINKAKPIWGEDMTDLYSPVALHFAATHNRALCFTFLEYLRKVKYTLLVGNENIPVPIRDLLFGPDCLFIPTPSKDSYSHVNRIEAECLLQLSKNKEYKLVVIAAGCSGRILQKRLWSKVDNVFFFDFGSLMDVLSGWYTRAWMTLTYFDEKEFLLDFAKIIEEDREKK